MDIDIEPKIIQRAGLTETEAKIYLVLLNLGKSLAGTIAKKAGIHRRTVYDVLDRLVEKGLVGYIKENKKRYYSITEPERLLDVVKENETELQKVVPYLQKINQEIRSKEETLFFKGKEGLKSIFEDQLRECKEILVIGGSLKAGEIVKYYFPRYHKIRREKNINLKIIYSKEYREKEEIPLSQIRYLPESYGSVAATNIYGDKVAIIVWTEEPVAILIKNNEVAKAYRSYFELLWDLSKE